MVRGLRGKDVMTAAADVMEDDEERLSAFDMMVFAGNEREIFERWYQKFTHSTDEVKMRVFAIY